MLRLRAQMALENVGSFQYLMYKRYIYIKKKSSPEKNLRALNFLIPGERMNLEIYYYLFRPLSPCFSGRHTHSRL